MNKNFIPKVWSTRMLAHLDKALVYGDVVNKDYEGEIRNFGDTIYINQIDNVTIADYDGTLEKPENFGTSQVALKIDKAKTFNVIIDDVIAAQANVPLVDEVTERGAYGIADEVDKDISEKVTEAGIKVGTASAPVTLTPENVYDTLVDLDVKLSEKNVPRTDRFIVLPPAVIGMLVKDPRFTRRDEVLDNGLVSVGKVAGFEVRGSNNVVKKAGKYHIMAGSKSAVAFAGQVNKLEVYRPELAFADAVKGLYVYGIEVIQPDALAEFIVRVDADSGE